MDLDTALREYTDGGPPTRLTSAGVLSAGRRTRRRRRLTVTGGAVAVLAATGVLLANLPGDPAPVQPSGPGWTALDPRPFCASDQQADRLTCYLQTEVSRRLPGATFHRKSTAKAGPLQVYRDGDAYTAAALVADEQGIGALGFSISLTAVPEDARERLCGPPPVCTKRTGPHGEAVTVLQAGSTRSYQHQLVNVRMYARGAALFASATNVTGDPSPRPGEGGVLEEQQVTRPDQPLSVDELVEILAGLTY
ncbi:hypothetical protein KZZ52_37520 [Dactylosporangium sp. AC04546]|uniref:hypothetical protein n=1 Tax=Dactylosporangium sp. AC04546 TaxID=2862460 RepID=UPI001EDFFDA5|nr:hypothetical protein [Dactylosporangium sp. AC04546]WVK79665.1 hypothetical protein KZZ52_37520 [Dactylosporangium sp. AC04546]